MNEIKAHITRDDYRLELVTDDYDQFKRVYEAAMQDNSLARDMVYECSKCHCKLWADPNLIYPHFCCGELMEVRK